MLVAARGLRRLGCERIFVPADDAAEAALVGGLEVIPCTTLTAVVNHVLDTEPIEPQAASVDFAMTSVDAEVDLAEVHGQEEAKRATGLTHPLRDPEPPVARAEELRGAAGGACDEPEDDDGRDRSEAPSAAGC